MNKIALNKIFCSVSFALLGATFTAGSLLAQIEVGSKAPAVKWETVFESDPDSLAKCKGKLVLLYFMRPSQVRNKQTVARLNGWFDRFSKRGLLLLCVFKQSTDTLESWVDDHKVKFALVSGPDVFKKFGVSVVPAYYFISGEGKVLRRDWREVPKLRMLEHFLATHVTTLEMPKGKPYDEIQKAWKKRLFGEVSILLAKARETASDDKQKKELQKVQDALGGQMMNVGEEMKTLAKGPDFKAAYERCVEIERQYKGLSLAAKAKEIKKAFRSDKRIMKEIKAIKELRGLQKRYDLKKNPKKRSKLMEKLRKFISKYPGLGASRLAKDVMDEIQ